MTRKNTSERYDEKDESNAKLEFDSEAFEDVKNRWKTIGKDGKKKGQGKLVKTAMFDGVLHRATSIINKKNRFEALEVTDEEMLTEKESEMTIKPNKEEEKKEDERKGNPKENMKRLGGAKRMLQTLTRAKKQSGALSVVKEEEKGTWKKISVAVDSGACDNVIGPAELPAYADRIKETEASINGYDFLSATGDPIENYGELKVPMLTKEGHGRAMVFQAAGVAKPLASVQKMNEAGNVVVFNGPESFVYNVKSGEINMLRLDDGNFMLDVWVPPPEVAERAGFRRQP